MDMQDLIMTEEDYRVLSEKATGIMIVHLNAIYHEDESWNSHSPMDYHLHILFVRDYEHNTLTAINLDTSDTITQPLENDRIHLQRREIGLLLSRTFIDRINSMIQIQKFDRESLFIKMDPILWEKFNHIKEESFARSLGRFTEYLRQGKGKDTTENSDNFSALNPAETHEHDWAQIRFAD